jgi:hypothetical protein
VSYICYEHLLYRNVFRIFGFLFVFTGPLATVLKDRGHREDFRALEDWFPFW